MNARFAFLQMLRWLVSALFFAAAAAHADERILAYHSDIRIDANGAMTVTETIRVRAEGVNIRRGLYRTFPTQYRDRLGNVYRVGFRVVGLTRNGRPEPWNAYRENNGMRVDFGNDDFLDVPAEYEYALEYRTNRQLGFFADHDELYWNVTGNGWDFPIDAASATVALPTAVPAASLVMEGYTGAQGASGRNYTAIVTDGQGTIRTTAPLRAREGLTLVLSWPKGVIHEPTRADRAAQVLGANRSILIALAALVGTVLWLGKAWLLVGRDPEPGVIFPHYEPPEGFTPAAARYVARMGYDGTAFTAALVNLAVKGHLQITEEKKKKFVLQRKASAEPLSDEERSLHAALFAGGETLVLDNRNHAVFSAAQAVQARALKALGGGRYFLNNGRYLLPSLLGSAALFVGTLVLGFMLPLAVGLYILIAILHIVFGILLKAPTPEGRKVMDRIEGFKLYLDVAEKDELKLLRDPPQLTPQLFERFLPYAIALEVEDAWARRFERALNALGEEQRHAYHPIWYTGAFHPGRIGDFTNSLGNSFGSAISSASTAPGTSSGSGGGGFSGGGGGGGGGGGR